MILDTAYAILRRLTQNLKFQILSNVIFFTSILFISIVIKMKTDEDIKQFLNSTSLNCNIKILIKIHHELFSDTMSMFAPSAHRTMYWRIIDAINDE